MNKIASVGLIAGMIVGLVGCGAKSPEDVVKQTLDILRSGKASESSLAETCTSDTSMFLANLGKDLADGLNGFDVKLAYIDDDVAAVAVLFRLSNGDGVGNATIEPVLAVYTYCPADNRQGG